MHLLKENRLYQSKPSQHATCHELILENIVLTTYDLGGHRQVRRIWKEYSIIADAIVFIIDVSHREWFEEAKIELNTILEMEEIPNIPVLILANKIDKYDSAGEQEIIDYFNLSTKLSGKNNFKPDKRPMEIFMCSMACKEGYGEAFKWLSNFF